MGHACGQADTRYSKRGEKNSILSCVGTHRQFVCCQQQGRGTTGGRGCRNAGSLSTDAGVACAIYTTAFCKPGDNCVGRTIVGPSHRSGCVSTLPFFYNHIMHILSIYLALKNNYLVICNVPMAATLGPSSVLQSKITLVWLVPEQHCCVCARHSAQVACNCCSFLMSS